MTTADNMRQIVDEMRDAGHRAADWMDAHPDRVSMANYGTMWIFADGADDFAVKVRELKDGAKIGEMAKKADDRYQDVIRDFGAGIKIAVAVTRSEVCEAVVVGQETVEEADPEAPKITVTRDIIEWKCAPILADVADVADEGDQ